MKSQFRSVERFALLLCLSIGLLAGCSQVTSTPASPPTGQVIALQPCYLSASGLGTSLEARCGSLTVYEDRQVQSGRQINLHIAVLPAVSRSPEADPIFFIAGGPGEAATESFLVVYAAFQLANQKRDIVLVDQRGVGQSHPLNCLEEEVDDSQEEGEAVAELQTCLQSLDADTRLYTTSIAMKDLDQVRQALGYARINIYGASYGTRAALDYARQFPEQTRTLILDGVAPPNWTLGPTTGEDAQRSLELIFQRCADTPTCQQAFPNLPQEFEALMKRLSKQPIEVVIDDPATGRPQPTTLTPEMIGSAVDTMSYASETAAMLPLMIHAAYADENYQPLAAQMFSSYNLVSQSISQGMRFSVVCAEDVPYYPESASPPQGYLGSWVEDSFTEICQTWPRGDIPAGFKEPVQSNVPTLLLSGEADPVTPPRNAELAAETLPNSIQIVVPGQGHIVVFRGCLPQLATQFVESGSIQGLETSCVQEIKPLPFFVNFNGPHP